MIESEITNCYFNISCNYYIFYHYNIFCNYDVFCNSEISLCQNERSCSIFCQTERSRRRSEESQRDSIESSGDSSLRFSQVKNFALNDKMGASNTTFCHFRESGNLITYRKDSIESSGDSSLCFSQVKNFAENDRIGALNTTFCHFRESGNLITYRKDSIESNIDSSLRFSQVKNFAENNRMGASHFVENDKIFFRFFASRLCRFALNDGISASYFALNNKKILSYLLENNENYKDIFSFVYNKFSCNKSADKIHTFKQAPPIFKPSFKANNKCYLIA